MEVQRSPLQTVTAELFHTWGITTQQTEKVSEFIKNNGSALKANELTTLMSKLQSRIKESEDAIGGVSGFFRYLFYPEKKKEQEDNVKNLHAVMLEVDTALYDNIFNYEFKDVVNHLYVHKDNLKEALIPFSKYLRQKDLDNSLKRDELNEFSDHLQSRIKEIKDDTLGVSGFFRYLLSPEKKKEQEKDLHAMEEILFDVKQIRIRDPRVFANIR